MTLEQKRDIVVKNKDPAIAALEAVTDRIYDITDPLLNDKGQLMTAKIGNFQVESFLKDLREDSTKYEKLKQKLQSGDFNLSLTEINYIALAFYFCEENLRGQVDTLNKAINLSKTLRLDLMSEDKSS